MWLAARKYPFAPTWNRDVFAAVKAAVSIPVFAVGGIRTPQEAAEILARGQADMIGIGRPFYAEPDLAARFLAEVHAPSATTTACESCNRCIVPQMLGMPGVCYNPEIHKIRQATPDALRRAPRAAAEGRLSPPVRAQKRSPQPAGAPRELPASSAATLLDLSRR
jgi:tRNA-dihydrouridine synthase